MNFQEAERTYEDLRAQYTAGKLSNSDFENEVSKLKVQDADGRWWQIGVQSGEWYVHDGQKWTKASPPVRPSAPPPAAPPPAPEAAAAAASVAATTAAAGPGPIPPSTPSGPSRLSPRFFSAAPAGRAGGLPTPLLVGIIAIAAVAIIVILIAAYMLASGQLGGGTPTVVAVKATNTPSGSVGLLPSPTALVLPTLAPPPASPTTIALPTAVITPTTAATPTRAVLATGAPTGPTATRRPVTPTAVVAPATKAPVLPPGVYVTKVRTEPAQPVFNQPIMFYVTFFNNTGNPGPSSWVIKIFKCAAACTGDELADNKSVGETPRVNKTVFPGTTELSAGPWQIGLGGCNFVATPYYVDGGGNLVPFQVQGGSRMYYNFKMC